MLCPDANPGRRGGKTATNRLSYGTAYLRRLVAGFQTQRLGFVPRSGHVGFVVDEVTLGEVSSKYFGFPW
jgi:hypothetical protein